MRFTCAQAFGREELELSHIVPWPFAEGNTRVALAAMVTYLEMNRLKWKCSEVKGPAMVETLVGQVPDSCLKS